MQSHILCVQNGCANRSINGCQCTFAQLHNQCYRKREVGENQTTSDVFGTSIFLVEESYDADQDQHPNLRPDGYAYADTTDISVKSGAALTVDIFVYSIRIRKGGPYEGDA